MIYENKKFNEKPDEIIRRRKQELYEMWSSKQMCAEEMERLEQFINYCIAQKQGTGTANDIVNDVKEVFEKYNVFCDGYADAVLVYLFELLEF